MNLVKEYKANTNFKTNEDVVKVLTNVINLGEIKSTYKKGKTIRIKEEINNFAIQFLENILSNNLASTKREKLILISLLDELNYRNEVLQLMGKENQASVKKAATSIGKKFISSKDC